MDNKDLNTVLLEKIIERDLAQSGAEAISDGVYKALGAKIYAKVENGTAFLKWEAAFDGIEQSKVSHINAAVGKYLDGAELAYDSSVGAHSVTVETKQREDIVRFFAMSLRIFISVLM